MQDAGLTVRRSPFAEKPMLVFWETTRACLLACRHCRAAAQREPLPGELSTAEAQALLREIRAFGTPPPVVVFTGGDLLMRRDIFGLIAEARTIGLKVAAAPAATELLTGDALRQLRDAGVSAVSLSIDAVGGEHDAIRGVPGTFQRTLEAARQALSLGLQVQVNSVVMRRTVRHLPALANLLLQEGIRTWEVFFLIVTGRAQAGQSLDPQTYDDVCHFLLDATRHGLLVRTVEGPVIRRVLRQREAGQVGGRLHRWLRRELRELAGEGQGGIRMGRVGTLDGDGIVFVGHDGTVTPGGFLPLALGNVRETSLGEIYRRDPLLGDIRRRRLHGACGHCPDRDACGGSRARAYLATGDALGPDPLCRYAAAGN